ncbi:lysosomal alpha-mannosidase isoform X1 [Harmonia axyridis]|uniref:lysosomal alpha-mannosidase isoform X1 n=1 Tax=Harmonia axyridis TaxID=115357 RepID=UPI001E276917|nr:lysosomal alpha-mannosidase isoform X1 [Harmonia axyridis]XP_045462133.1 lysosomal alpha-mannosidase isoform X1 [Harmonia axyridis]
MIKLLMLSVMWAACSAMPTKNNEATCGYESCHPVKEGMINVHIVAHTHDDVGWLKTVDQYYYGSKSSIQKAGVQYILDSVTDALKKNPDRRFIYVETAFFWKWWMNQPDHIKHQFKRYVNSGQLEFIGGAWSMNDEATTHYQSIIDQFTWGLRKLNETFGSCGRPKLGWQIDPFGHSREMASIFAQLGFDGLLLGRIDYQDKGNRFKTRTPEVVWKGSDNLGEAAHLFTGVMYNTYSPPSGFCFDILCEDEPIIDDVHSPDYNVDKRVNNFLIKLQLMREQYSTDNIIVTMGDDFNYQDANTWFTNLDKLIHYANLRQANGSQFNLIYSTPSCYVKAVHDEAEKKGMKWKTKSDDYFPYASDPHSFWTGYFTSRPTIKRFERIGNNFLQVCKQLYSLADLGPEDQVDLNALRQAMGVMQHHDAVTGTEKEHVAHDYARILTEGIKECEIITSAALNKLIKNQSSEDVDIKFSSCPLANVSSCSFTENTETFTVTVYNPLSRPVNHYVRFPILGEAYRITDDAGVQIETQLVPIASSVLSIPGRKSEATMDLVFRASEIPPLGFKSYYVESVKKEEVTAPKMNEDDYTGVKLEIDQTTGLIASVTMNNITVSLTQQYLYYEGYIGNNEIFVNRSSGAYIFRPRNNEPIAASNRANYTIHRGNLVTEIHQKFNDWISQVVRMYKEENVIEFDWVVGPLPSEDTFGKEVINRFQTDLSTNATFYTDSNGREILKRVRNFRPTWKLDLEEPVSGNYYPVTSKILMRDTVRNIEVAVLTDRAQGGSSLHDGELELMVHRNCLHDDAFGVGEALNEKAFGAGLVAKGSHYLMVGNISSDGYSLAAAERDLAQRKLLQAWTFFSPAEKQSIEDYKRKFAMNYSGLRKSLPKNVQILTLEPWIGTSLLLRLEHVLEKDEDSTLSQPAIVNLKALFTPFEVTSIRETTLGANQWLSENSRLQFATEDVNFERNPRYIVVNAEDEFEIRLNPMQIRTFIVDVVRK